MATQVARSGGQVPDSAGITLGRILDPSSNSIGEKLVYHGERHCLVFGPNGSGKGVRLLTPWLLQGAIGRSVCVIDPKGELAAMTAPFRRQVGHVVIINPFGVLTDREGFDDLQSQGYNPLAALDPASTSFNVQAALLAEAMIEVGGKDPHWDESARNLVAALIMFVVLEARGMVAPFPIDGKIPRPGNPPTIARVRRLLCMPSLSPGETGDGEGMGLPKLARMMARSGVAGLRNKAAQFTEWNNEIQGIASAAKRHTEPFDDAEMVADTAKGTFDFRQMKREPVTVYLILPPEMMQRHAKWLRLLVTAAVHASMRPRESGEPGVVFLFDEFAALGHMSIIETTWALVRGYGVMMIPVFQDLNQLKAIYKERWETFIGMAGAVASFAPNDLTTSDWLSRRAGETTKIVLGYNTGENVSTGTSSSQSTGATQNSSSGYSENSGTSSGFSFQQTKVPLMPAHRLFGLGEGTLMVYAAGLSDMIPAYAPAYWQIEQCVARARVNPYYHPVPKRHALASPAPQQQQGLGNGWVFRPTPAPTGTWGAPNAQPANIHTVQINIKN